MKRFSTLQELLDVGADDAIALAAPACPPLTYRGLRAPWPAASDA